jgi:hypothetical protein
MAHSITNSSTLSSLDPADFMDYEMEMASEKTARNQNILTKQFTPRYTEAELAQKHESVQDFLRDPDSFIRMIGSTRGLLQQKELSSRLMASLNGTEVKRFIDGFGGTGIVTQWAKFTGMLPAQQILNELTPYRHMDLMLTVHQRDEVIAALDKHGLEIRKILYRVKMKLDPSAQVSEQALVEWEADKKASFSSSQAREGTQRVKQYLLDAAEEHFDDSVKEPVVCADNVAIHKYLQCHMRHALPLTVESRPVQAEDAGDGKDRNFRLYLPGEPFHLQTLGTNAELKDRKGRNTTWESIKKIRSAVGRIAASLPGLKVTRQDGYTLCQNAQRGDVVFLDPPYIADKKNISHAGKNTVSSTRYIEGDLEEYYVGNWDIIAEKIETPWRNGLDVPITITNRYDDKLRVLMESRGWWASGPLIAPHKKKDATPEIIFTNYDVHNGAARMRIPGEARLLARLALAHDGRLLNAECLIKGKSVQLEGVVIGDAMYAEVDGTLKRFEEIIESRSGSRLNENISAVNLHGLRWSLSSNQRNIPQPDSAVPQSAIHMQAHAASATRNRLYKQLAESR